MIISHTPFRISFFGGGTDYPAWYREHGGATLVTSIDKYCRISCRHLPPFFEYRHRLVYSKIETINQLSEIQHPAAKAVMTHMGVDRGLEIHHDGDLPARSGLASSSAFTVGLINTLMALEGKMVSKFDLSRQGIHLEQNILKEAVGSQDQIATAYGGFNHIVFSQDDSFTVSPVMISRDRKEEFQKHLMLFFTGFQRNAIEVAKKQIDNMQQRKKELHAMHAMVGDALAVLTNANSPLSDIGLLLNESWRLKRSLAEGISTPFIDEVYETAMKNGATGGKILGAGGGGFMIFFAPPEHQAKIRKALAKLVHVGFRFEFGGSKIAHYDPGF